MTITMRMSTRNTLASAVAQAAWNSHGLDAQRLARIAARRAFVEMKQAFMRAAADVDGPVGELLQRKTRLAAEPTDLWRLRAALLASLPSHHQRTPLHRLELHRQLDSLFPVDASDTAVVAL
jgi:hypothetical protein